LQWLIVRLRDQYGIDVQLQSNSSQGFMSVPLKTFLFRGVQELLFNVVKHAKVQSASVVLSNREREIAIEVSDRGRGFDPDILNTTTKKVGLGLLSLRERCRYIGGSFVIDSSPGHGSRITLAVPRGEGIQQLADGQPLTKSESPPPAPSGITRLLIVDDHQVMRSGLVRMFRDQPGIRIVGEAANGREAIEQARQLRPSLILMDVSMPVLDGIEATRLIKAEMPEVEIIALSMHEDTQIAGSMREAGAVAFLSKASAADELLRAITRVASRQNASFSTGLNS
jgi:CheY-like chemotaxis protein